jgi:hypothetical protein
MEPINETQSIQFPVVQSGESWEKIPPPVISEHKAAYWKERLDDEELRKTAWSVLPSALSLILKALHPDLKSPRTLPNDRWIRYLAVYESWHLTVFSMPYGLIQRSENSDLFWGGDYNTLLLVQLTATKTQFDRRNSTKNQKS